MQLIITIIIVTIAVLFAARGLVRTLRRKKGDGCGCGCEGCNKRCDCNK